MYTQCTDNSLIVLTFVSRYNVIMLAKANAKMNYGLLLPCAHAQGIKQSILSVLSVCRCHENHHISSSRHLCVL